MVEEKQASEQLTKWLNDPLGEDDFEEMRLLSERSMEYDEDERLMDELLGEFDGFEINKKSTNKKAPPEMKSPSEITIQPPGDKKSNEKRTVVQMNLEDLNLLGGARENIVQVNGMYVICCLELDLLGSKRFQLQHLFMLNRQRGNTRTNLIRRRRGEESRKRKETKS
jgi:hypothetical protein